MPDGGQVESSDEAEELAVDANAAQPAWDWSTDPSNPYNWSAGKKAWQVAMISSVGFIASIGTSIISPAHTQLMAEFDVTSTQAILPLSLYVFALAFGPVIGGPLSETIGRYLLYAGGLPLGGLFTLGAGLTNSFAGLCILRFLAGTCFAPSLSVSSGLLNEIYLPAHRAIPSTLFILTPFLGPGLGPVIGGFIVNRKGWRWTQWAMLFFAAFSMVITLVFGRETYHPVLKHRRARELGQTVPKQPPLRKQILAFITIALLRPVHMLATEPIVSFVCLYVACEFATLFTLFSAVPYTFQRTYAFSIEQSGLVFLSIAVGCLLGTLTILLCDVFLYRRQIPRHPPHQVPPEYRLYPAMVGSIGLPVGLFWFAWTARPDISWASPTLAIVPFAWGNICIFISTMQYMVDTYHGTNVASAASANSLARYGLAGAFPLFTSQMYSALGIGWATSLLGFIAVALLPVPWVFFQFGKQIRARSKYETASY
ncbi:MFS general substrate transporter [Thozetella sp. PMI_491]|nr:MFS general substrate transporter [Thozetella sp. PMI_491]